MEAALERAHRVRFSDTSFVEPLKQLLAAYREEADLSPFGCRAARFDVMRCLLNLLRLDAEEEENPAIPARRIERPIFITGMPRSATTFLHTLLSLDPANRVPRCFELLYPYPPRARLLPFDIRKARVALQLRIFHLLIAPNLARLHRTAADSPQECTDITAQVFQSLRFENTYRVPSYQAWLDRHGHESAFRFHRRFLQHLDRQQPGRRWILKSPDHVFALKAIRRIYPDAEIVFLHRDPLQVVASCAKLMEELHRPFTNHIDPVEIGRQVSVRLMQSAGRMMEAAAGPDRILHLHYADVVADPRHALEQVYRHCGLTMGEEARQRLTSFLTTPRPRAARRYSLSEFGLDTAPLRERFARYADRFGVGLEAAGLNSA